MRESRDTVLSAVACLLISTVALAAQNDARAAIEAANKQFIAALAKGDAAALAGMYTVSAIAFPPNAEPMKGRAAIEKMWQGVVAGGIKGATLTTSDVETHGDTAYEVGSYEMKVDGGKVVDRGKYIVIWKREQGQWKLHRDIWNTSMPPAK
jgi:uncharacterized protein (TIGR02246 family)